MNTIFCHVFKAISSFLDWTVNSISYKGKKGKYKTDRRKKEADDRFDVPVGVQILLEMLSQRKDICAYALVESAAVIPSKLTNLLIAPTFGGSYGLMKNIGGFFFLLSVFTGLVQ